MSAYTDSVPNELLLDILRLATYSSSPAQTHGVVAELPPSDPVSMRTKLSASLVSRRFHKLAQNFVWEHVKLRLGLDARRMFNDHFLDLASPHVVHIQLSIIPSTFTDFHRRWMDIFMQRSPRLRALTAVLRGVDKLGSGHVYGISHVEGLLNSLPDRLHFLHWHAVTSARADAVILPALGRLVSLRVLVLKFHECTAIPAPVSQYRRRWNVGAVTLPQLRELRVCSPDVLVADVELCDLRLPQLTHWNTASDPALFMRPGLCFPTVTHAHFTPFAADMYPPEHVANPLQQLFPGLQYLSYVFEATAESTSDVNITDLLHAGLPPRLHTMRMIASSLAMRFYCVPTLTEHLEFIPFHTAPDLRYLELAGNDRSSDNLYALWMRQAMDAAFKRFAVRLQESSHPSLEVRFV